MSQGPMERHFFQDIEKLKTDLIRMCSFAEQAIADAIRAFLECRHETAQQVINQDRQINAFEIIIDDSVFDLLALQQPVASDLRFILAASKINNDLERIGDHAVNIAESAISCSELPRMAPVVDITRMAQITKGMLRDSIDGFIHSNPTICQAVLKNDDLIDKLNKKICDDVVAIIKANPDTAYEALEVMRVSRNLERVADLATNIAEEVIFVTEAKVVKHHQSGKKPGR